MPTAIIYCDLLFELETKGKAPATFDLFIAALAMEHDYTLVTGDTDFKEIPGLKLKYIEL